MNEGKLNAVDSKSLMMMMLLVERGHEQWKGKGKWDGT